MFYAIHNNLIDCYIIFLFVKNDRNESGGAEIIGRFYVVSINKRANDRKFTFRGIPTIKSSVLCTTRVLIKFR